MQPTTTPCSSYYEVTTLISKDKTITTAITRTTETHVHIYLCEACRRSLPNCFAFKDYQTLTLQLVVLAVSLNNGSSLNKLCAVIRTKFNEISSADFTVKYVLPGSEPCVLLSDEYMGFMFAFIPLVMEEHVELIV
ncbi:hypothetical protein LguiA_020300 [Lonicera macranthoides]